MCGVPVVALCALSVTSSVSLSDCSKAAALAMVTTGPPGFISCPCGASVPHLNHGGGVYGVVDKQEERQIPRYLATLVCLPFHFA